MRKEWGSEGLRGLRREARESGFSARRGRGKSNVVAVRSFAKCSAAWVRLRGPHLASRGRRKVPRSAAMPLLRCFSSLGCPELSLEETLALAQRREVPAVELRALGGTVDLAAYFAKEYDTPERLAARLARSPVRLVAFNASLRLMGPTEADRAQLIGLAPWAHAAGVRWLRVFDGGRNVDAAETRLARETLAWWAELRAQHGWQVELMIETHDALFSAAALRRFLAAVPDAAILWDAHHTWRKGGEDPLATWAAIRPSVVHVHVKDSIDVPSARHSYTYVLPGDGGFPIAPLRAALERDAFSGPVSLEWERMWHPYLPTLDEALRVAVERGWW